jgi:hypothetical protein
MLKIKSILETEVNGRKYEFTCPPDSPLNDALEAEGQFKAFLLGRQQMASEQNKPAEEAKAEDGK